MREKKEKKEGLSKQWEAKLWPPNHNTKDLEITHAEKGVAGMRKN